MDDSSIIANQLVDDSSFVTLSGDKFKLHPLYNFTNFYFNSFQLSSSFQRTDVRDHSFALLIDSGGSDAGPGLLTNQIL